MTDNFTKHGIDMRMTDITYRDVVIIRKETSVTEFGSNKKIFYIVVYNLPLTSDVNGGVVKHYDTCPKFMGYPVFRKLCAAKKFIDETTNCDITPS